jgi:hypothetical protein
MSCDENCPRRRRSDCPRKGSRPGPIPSGTLRSWTATGEKIARRRGGSIRHGPRRNRKIRRRRRKAPAVFRGLFLHVRAVSPKSLDFPLPPFPDGRSGRETETAGEREEAPETEPMGGTLVKFYAVVNKRDGGLAGPRQPSAARGGFSLPKTDFHSIGRLLCPRHPQSRRSGRHC